VSLFGGATSASLFSTWLILFGYSFATHASANFAKRSAAFSSKLGAVSVAATEIDATSSKTARKRFMLVPDRNRSCRSARARGKSEHASSLSFTREIDIY
jgi:hypothetical protein